MLAFIVTFHPAADDLARRLRLAEDDRGPGADAKNGPE